ncbi:translation initiation factor IF-2 [Thecaphora frezii]
MLHRLALATPAPRSTPLSLSLRQHFRHPLSFAPARLPFSTASSLSAPPPRPTTQYSGNRNSPGGPRGGPSRGPQGHRGARGAEEQRFNRDPPPHRRAGGEIGGAAGPRDRRHQGRGVPVPRPRDWRINSDRSDAPTAATQGREVKMSNNGFGAGLPESVGADEDLGAGSVPEGSFSGHGGRGGPDKGGGRGDRQSRKKGDRGSLLTDEAANDHGYPSRDRDRGGKKGASSSFAGSRSKAKGAALTKAAPAPPRQVFLPSVVTVSNLARQMDVKMRTLQNVMSKSGFTDTRPDLILTFSDAEMLAAEFNLTAVVNEEAAFDIYPRDPLTPEDYAKLPLRPPVVTIMGHVDHGKTTLLDKLRSTSVAAGEAGGITQHIGAFSVPVKRASEQVDGDAVKTVTFLDTPGHAAFTAMRSRGAAVTDIVVLVVAADDGVMPQTKEVIELVRSLSSESGTQQPNQPNQQGRRRQGGVQMVVALTKVDKTESDAEGVKRQLLAAGVELEELGGEVPCVEVSGKTGAGLDDLEETLAVVAELADLRAERQGRMEGYVIESKVEKGRGNVATVLVKRGCVQVGDLVIAGTAWCKVRQIVDSNGKSLRVAYPGDAVVVTGWKELVMAGEEVLGAEEEASLKKAVENRKRKEERREMMKDVEAINMQRRARAEEAEAKAKREFEERQRRRLERLEAGKGVESVLQEEAAEPAPPDEGNADASGLGDAAAAEADEAASNKKMLNLIVKADYTGTVEAVVGAISSIGTSEAGVKIISSGVGPPTESEVAKASALSGHILCFNVPIPKPIATLGSRAHPPVTLYTDTVIYRLMEHVSEQVVSLLPPLYEQRITGEATISALFSISISSKVSRKVAGCRVVNGAVAKNSMVRVLRGPERNVIWSGKLAELRQGKKTVDEMKKGTECGVCFDGFEAFQEGDVVQCYYEVPVKRSL